jgi:hypothetical protein
MTAFSPFSRLYCIWQDEEGPDAFCIEIQIRPGAFFSIFAADASEWGDAFQSICRGMVPLISLLFAAGQLTRKLIDDGIRVLKTKSRTAAPPHLLQAKNVAGSLATASSGSKDPSAPPTDGEARVVPCMLANSNQGWCVERYSSNGLFKKGCWIPMHLFGQEEKAMAASYSINRLNKTPVI